ncbi:CMP-KDO synthetase related protein [Leptospira biflexa serovar Patoc strain 'Patoc 1 (Ames)']|uniref:Putative acylneuraminate cytidylyltransferase n=1 Tax=Leptospira biflexa serovar Patoc (strain Patoc 1 / ATCC 23582 / Paris) TaxID=456481 RepID=B0SSN8_LEPBP|nr:glycosyltransferase family protein [Leptospira biflexa]ABZ94473.1 CMP-KDO synthetase related protein [Leptospira biflexa serovar Patoc strain 'Patoc 1 (Ames)']ABZ98128.1 Putative acylneuraminate cytidylyltransferase [Leptospira biflexa serovar Patoc strain 'Patoc 1 (Paris)']
MEKAKTKIVATIEARMTSSRLPGKVLKEVFNKPMLYYLVQRLRMVPSIDEIVLATTINKTDDVLIDFAKIEGISYFRGSEDDVMSRVVGAGESAKADVIVEITADCPIIDPAVVDQTIQLYLHNPCDYASNVIVRSYPIGMDTQVFSLDTLKKSFSMTEDKLDREHVTRHIRQNPDLFKQVHLVSSYLDYWPELAVTLDEVSDYELIKKIIEYFYEKNPYFSCADIVALIKEKESWLDINRDVKRKGLN